MNNNFATFLTKNTIVPASKLPIIHSTASYYIKSISSDDKIHPQMCDVFKEELTYFFVGRPAYKAVGDKVEASTWELPACFIFEYSAIGAFHRVFPFDTGAFASGRMPKYIGMMEKESFEAHSVSDAPTKIIGAYFPAVESYISGQAKEAGSFMKEFGLGVFDAEVQALHRLARETSYAGLDDRRLTVEVQTTEEVDLLKATPLAVVVPAPYLDNPEFLDRVTSKWKAVPIGYSVSSLNVEHYYGQIYEKVTEFYKTMGIL